MELLGTKGTIIIEFGSWDKYCVSVFEKDKGSWDFIECPSQRNDMFRDEDREFLEAIVHDRPISLDIEEASKVVMVMDSVKNNIS